MRVERQRTGLTLIELLVVIAILATLVGMLLPAVQKVRAAAAAAKCRNNLRQIAIAVHDYHDAHDAFPVNSLPGPSGPYGPATKAWSWLARVLPHVEQAPLFEQAGIQTRTLSQSRAAVATAVPVYRCPSDPSDAVRSDAADLGVWFEPHIAASPTNYKGVSGANWGWGDPKWQNPGTNGSSDGLNRGDGMFYRTDWRQRKTLVTISDGTSNTLMIGEDLPDRNHWFAWAYANSSSATCAIPPNTPYPDTPGHDYSWNWHHSLAFRSRHTGGTHFARVDGSVLFVEDRIELRVYRAMATIRGGEIANYP